MVLFTGIDNLIGACNAEGENKMISFHINCDPAPPVQHRPIFRRLRRGLMRVINPNAREKLALQMLLKKSNIPIPKNLVRKE